MGRLAIALAALMLSTALAGCFFDEELAVAMRVTPGETAVVDRDRFVDGTLLVENGGTLVLEGAHLRIAQALVIEPGARVMLRGGIVEFRGDYARQDIETAGTLEVVGTRLDGVRDLQVLGGEATLRNGSVEAGHVQVAGGTLHSHGADWALGPPRASSFGTRADTTVQVFGGMLSIENGSLEVEGRSGILVQAGEARLRNLTLRSDLDGGGGGRTLTARGGLLEARNVVFHEQGSGRLIEADGGTLRLIDAPLPQREDVFFVGANGRLEVGWTLTARAVSPPGGIPVAGIDVTLTSAHAPGEASDSGTTDANGEVPLVALQYVYDRFGSRSGNPHALTASGGGKHGAMTGIVMEGPATVVVPVFG